jgi:suppressor of ftsI
VERDARTSRRGRGLALGVVLGTALLFAIGALAQAGVRPAASGWNPVAGLPLQEPPRIASSGGVLKATLTAREQQITVSGDQLTARVYNGSITGPTLVVKPGDTMRVTLVNRLDEPTNLHVHGLHVSPSGSADNVFRMIQPGSQFTYVIHLPDDHPSGLYWYHAHVHHLAGGQVFGGLSGLIVVDGITRFLPQGLRGITQRELALRDLQVTDGAVVAHQTSPNTVRVVDGLLRPAFSIRPGETQLWRFANIGANTFYKLAFAGEAFHVVAEDGRPVWRVWSARTLVLPPGKRYEVLVQGPPKGTYPLKTLAFYAGSTAGGDFAGDYPQAVLATVTSTGTAVQRAPIPTAFGPKEDLSGAHIAKSFQLTFGRTGVFPAVFTLNGKTYDPNRIDARAKLGTVQEWNLVNATGDWHPFHMHTNYFQVMSVGGEPYHARGLQDTVPIPPHSNVVVRIEFEDFVGKTVYHCHILAHEDRGMMANIVISK